MITDDFKMILSSDWGQMRQVMKSMTRFDTNLNCFNLRFIHCFNKQTNQNELLLRIIQFFQVSTFDNSEKYYKKFNQIVNSMTNFKNYMTCLRVWSSRFIWFSREGVEFVGTFQFTLPIRFGPKRERKSLSQCSSSSFGKSSIQNMVQSSEKSSVQCSSPSFGKSSVQRMVQSFSSDLLSRTDQNFEKSSNQSPDQSSVQSFGKIPDPSSDQNVVQDGDSYLFSDFEE